MYSVTVVHRRLGTVGISFFGLVLVVGVGVGLGLAFCVAGVGVVLVKYFSGSREGRSFLHTSITVGLETAIAMVLQ